VDVLNPVDIETRIRQLADGIARGVKVCTDAYERYLLADREHDRARARAFLLADGSMDVRKYKAELAPEVVTTRDALDVADAAYRYADRNAKALESELRAYQSVGASVRQMYAVAGRGEG
jgi:hypothetical protein